MSNSAIFIYRKFILLVIIIVSLFFLAFTSQKNFSVSNNVVQKIVQYYDPSINALSESAEVEIIKNKVFIKIASLKLNKEVIGDIKIENIMIAFNMFNFNTDLDLYVSKGNLGNLVKFAKGIESTKIVDDFFEQNFFNCDVNLKANLLLFYLRKAEINIKSVDGWHQAKVQGSKKLILKNFDFFAIYQNDILSVNKFNLEYLNNFSGSLSGDFKTSDNQLVFAKFKTELSNFPIEYLGEFWDESLFPGARSWITKNISNGVATKAKGEFNLIEDDFQNNLLSKESIDVTINFSDIELNYLPLFSPITKINGAIKFDGLGMQMKAASAMMQRNKLENIELTIPFNTWKLQLKTNVNGAIANFKEFIPEEVINRLKIYNTDYDLIKGNANAIVEINIPLVDNFSIEMLGLVIKADIENFVLNNADVIKFTKGKCEIVNDANKLKFIISSEKDIFLDIEIKHDSDPNTFGFLLKSEILLKDKISLKDNVFLSGMVKAQVSRSNDNWEISLNLNDADLSIPLLSYNNSLGSLMNFNCSGVFKENEVVSNVCALEGEKTKGKISFSYSTKDSILTKLKMENIILESNVFNANISYDKKLLNFILDATFLDLSNFSSNAFTSGQDDKLNYNLDLKVKKVLMPNKSTLNDLSSKITKVNNSPIIIDLKAFDNGKKITLVKIKRNNIDGYFLYSDDAATFTQDFGIYQNIKKGELWLEMHPKKVGDELSYYGTIKLNKFAFTQTSAFAKIILGVTSVLNSPQALARALQGGSLQADSFNGDITYHNGIITLKNGVISGPSYDIKIFGEIDLNQKTLSFKGIYIPSVYGLNALVENIPLIGKFISGGKNSALIGANFSITGKLSNPNVFFNPLTILTPGFIRNLF
ncbi:MAG: DUF3971 domain-containing protein [Rickettsiales bacterium]